MGGKMNLAGGVMVRWLLVAAIAVVSALPAAAQQRPPQRPEPQAETDAAPLASTALDTRVTPDVSTSVTGQPVTDRRPPAKPPALPQRAQPMTTGKDSPTEDDTDDMALTTGASPNAPNTDTDAHTDTPPAWQALRESDFDHAICRLGLSVLGAKWQAAAPVSDPQHRDCGIARPIRLTQVVPGVDIPGGALMRCDLALALALWTREFVQPAAQHLPGSPRLTGLVPGSTYQWRMRVGGGQSKLSQHALGNAFDIMAFRFHGHDDLTVSPRQDSGDMAEAFQRTVHSAACLYFTTVLGPGSNAAHDDHLHLDLVARKGGWRLCQ